MRIVVATSNRGKSREFREMLVDQQIDWADLTEFPGTADVEETGHTFRANACIKASHYATQLNTSALADDSGLAVDALDGKPGVYSARWAQMQGSGSGDADNNATVLRQLADVPDDRRSARFVCVLALADPKGRIVLTVQDAVEGVIRRGARGTNGFGYDPLFHVVQMNKAMAELPPDEKHAISHRGRALKRLRQLMERLPPGWADVS